MAFSGSQCSSCMTCLLDCSAAEAWRTVRARMPSLAQLRLNREQTLKLRPLSEIAAVHSCVASSFSPCSWPCVMDLAACIWSSATAWHLPQIGAALWIDLVDKHLKHTKCSCGNVSQAIIRLEQLVQVLRLADSSRHRPRPQVLRPGPWETISGLGLRRPLSIRALGGFSASRSSNLSFCCTFSGTITAPYM